MLDVCCVADLCMDLILTGDVIPRFRQIEQLLDSYALEMGGSATIFASQFAKLGGRVGLTGVVGEDPFGHALREGLASIGVDIGRVRTSYELQTGLGVALVKPDGDRATLTYLGTIAAPEPSDLPGDVAASCRHWHVASPFLLSNLRGHWPGWLTRCRAAGLTTSLDTNWDPEGRWDGVHELLPLIDVFLPNEAEALAIAGTASVAEAGEVLSRGGPLVVVKQGADGASAFQGGRSWHRGVGDIPEADLPIRDSVGAGDNFDAGFLRAWLLGREIQECLQLATRCARSSLSARGGIQGQLRETIA